MRRPNMSETEAWPVKLTGIPRSWPERSSEERISWREAGADGSLEPHSQGRAGVVRPPPRGERTIDRSADWGRDEVLAGTQQHARQTLLWQHAAAPFRGAHV